MTWSSVGAPVPEPNLAPPAGDAGCPAAGRGDLGVELLEAARSALTQVLDVRGWDATAEVVRERMRAAHEVLAIADAARLAAIRCLQDHPEAVPDAAPGTAAATYAIHVLQVSPQQARRDVVVAEAIDPDGPVLPLLGAALAAGRVSRAHVEVAVSAVQQLPAALKRLVLDDGRTALQWIDAFLVDNSRRLSAASVKILTRELLARLDPDRAADLNADAVARRGMSLRTGPTGMLEGRFSLDPATGVQVAAILEHYARPHPTGTHTGTHTGEGEGEGESRGGGEGQEALFRDTRSRSQRLADALTTVTLMAARNSDPTQPDHPTSDPTSDPTGDPTSDPEAGSGGGSPTSPGHATGAADRERTLGPRTEIVVTVPLAQLAAAFAATGTPIPAWAGTPPRSPHPDTDPTTDTAAHSGPGAGTPTRPGGWPDTPDGLARAALAGQGDWPGATLDPATLTRLACEAWFRPLIVNDRGVPLHLGRARRLATPAQRAAIIARDAGCVIPACTAPATWCEVHHVTPWRDGGRTDLDTMALVCPRHHTDIHAGIWHLTMRHGTCWAIPPTWIDPHQHPRRNTTHLARTHANHLARHLHHQQLQLRFPHAAPPRTAPAARPQATRAAPRRAVHPPSLQCTAPRDRAHTAPLDLRHTVLPAVPRGPRAAAVPRHRPGAHAVGSTARTSGPSAHAPGPSP